MSPLPWPAALIVLLALSLGSAAVFIPVMGRLAEPVPADPDKIPYAALATRRHAGSAACWTALLALPAVVLVSTGRLVPWLVFAVVGGIAATVDIVTTWIPRRLLHVAWLTAAVAAVVSTLVTGDLGALLRAVVGSLTMGLLFWIVHLVAGLGFSDVRLGFLIGGVCAWQSVDTWLIAVVAGTMLGAVWGLVTAFRRGRDGPFPYGPSLLAGASIALVLA